MDRLKNFSDGRGYFVEDIAVLQRQLSLMQAFFMGENPFIVGGCWIDSNVGSVAPGLVWLGGRLLWFGGAGPNLTFPIYLELGPEVDYAFFQNTKTPQNVERDLYDWIPVTGSTRYYDLADTEKPSFSTQTIIVRTVPQGNPGTYITISNAEGFVKQDLYDLIYRKLAFGQALQRIGGLEGNFNNLNQAVSTLTDFVGDQTLLLGGRSVSVVNQSATDQDVCTIVIPESKRGVLCLFTFSGQLQGTDVIEITLEVWDGPNLFDSYVVSADRDGSSTSRMPVSFCFPMSVSGETVRVVRKGGGNAVQLANAVATVR